MSARAQGTLSVRPDPGLVELGARALSAMGTEPDAWWPVAELSRRLGASGPRLGHALRHWTVRRKVEQRRKVTGRNGAVSSAYRLRAST